MRKITIYNTLNGLLHKAGFDIRRFPTRDQRQLIKYLLDNNVNDCIDVGANTGQYARHLRAIGFKGNIMSFEPQKNAFEKLQKAAAHDDRWKVYNVALGNADEESTINISRNSVSSSILEISEFLTDTAPETTYISREKIKVSRLDSFAVREDLKRRLFVKIDTQGFESRILEGAEGCFDHVYALQLELSCIGLYKGEKLFEEMKINIESRGFYLCSLESGFADPKTGRLLQVEGIFLRQV